MSDCGTPKGSQLNCEQKKLIKEEVALILEKKYNKDRIVALILLILGAIYLIAVLFFHFPVFPRRFARIIAVVSLLVSGIAAWLPNKAQQSTNAAAFVIAAIALVTL